MGHIKRKRPKRGAKQVWPRKRAKREYPTVSTWSAHSDLKPLAFAGYKAGMTHIQYRGRSVSVPDSGYLPLNFLISFIPRNPDELALAALADSFQGGLEAVGGVYPVLNHQPSGTRP